jgi:replicative DNA helicase
LTHDREAEAALIAAIMGDPKIVYEVMPELDPFDLYVEKHRVILDAIYDVAENGDGRIDIVSLRHVLNGKGEMETVGGAVGLSELFDVLPDVANWRAYLEIIRRHARSRELVRVGRLLQNEDTPVEDRASLAMEKITALSVQGEQKRLLTGSDIFRKIESTIDAGVDPRMFKTGIAHLDGFLTIRRGNVVVIAGNPGTGKSALALQVAQRVANRHGPMVFFSLEMSTYELGERMIQGTTGCGANVISTPQFTTKENRAKIKEALKPTEGMDRALFLDPGVITPQEALAYARMAQIRFGDLKAVFVDYLQLMRCPEKGYGSVERTTWLSRQMKAMARTLEVPVVVLSQLSRGQVKDGREPQLHDLRDSGAIEQDADIVIFTHRPDPDQDNFKLIVRKQRHGPVGSARVKFDGGRCRFVSITDVY